MTQTGQTASGAPRTVDGLSRCGRSLVPGKPGDQHRGTRAGPLLLAALRPAHRHRRAILPMSRDRHQHSRPDRSPRPQEHRSHSLGTAGDTRAAGRSAAHGRPRVAKRVNRLRNRLILIFLAATLAPLAAHMWITTSAAGGERRYLFHRPARHRSPDRSKRTGREFYERASDDLKRRARAGEIGRADTIRVGSRLVARRVKRLRRRLEGDRFVRAGQDGDRLDYLVRHGNEIWVYSENLGDVAMERLTRRDPRGARRWKRRTRATCGAASS